MGIIKRMFQLSLTQKEIVKSKRFMAIVMIPVFVFQMSSLNLVLLQVAIAEDGESASVAVEEPAVEPAIEEEEAPAPEEPADEPVEEVQLEEEAGPKEEPAVEEAPSVLDEIVPDSIPGAIVDSAKETPTTPEVVEDDSAENNEGGRITPEAAYDEVEAPTQTPSVQDLKVQEGWRENSDGSSSIMVTAGNEYEYKDSGLKIKFTRIDSGNGEITVKEIELTDEQVVELSALSKKAWDITSNMADGTFEYELTLPVEENVDESKIQLVYAEEKEDLNNEEKIKTVEKEDVKVDGEKNELTANGLDHFTIYLVKEKLSNESLVTVASSGSTITNGCMDDLYPGNLVCSANDIDIADVTGIMINDDGCAFPGDTVTFTANWNVEASANERYDVGLYFSTDGDPNNDGAYTGSCSITTLPNSPTPPWFDFDGDFCGDASSSTNVTPTIQQTVQCLDTDGDNKLNLPYCTSWRQNDDDVCNSPLDAFPGAPSKCNCDKGFEIPITVPYGAYIEVIKDLIPSNDGGKFNLQIDGVDKKIDASDSGTTGKVSVGAGTSASPGAMHTVGETSGTGTVLSDYASSISCVDRGLSTFDGGAPLMFSGTGPLNVDVDKDDDIVCTITNSLQQANLTLVKTVTNNNGGTALLTAWTLSASGPTSISGVTGSASITNAPVDIGTYTLSESVGPTGYVASNYSCVKNGGAAIEGNSITLAAGDNATCTINNDDQSGTLIVKKIVVNDNGGTKVAADFKFSVDGGMETYFEADGQNDLTVSAGTYDIVESPVSGYTTTYTNCTDIVVPNGGSATCTITNNDQPASLTVIKHVINDNGGTAAAGDFTMNVTGTNVSDSSFLGVESPGTTVTLNAGSFSVDEGAFSGYTKTIGSNCSGTIANGENKTCTITNDDQPGTLIVKKEITNDNGGNNVCKDFSFNYGTGVIAFEEDCQNEFSVPAGTYTVAEIAAAGYETIYDNCYNVSVPNGGTAICTVKNNDLAPNLTVIKRITNDDGGNETVDAFEIKMNDNALSFGAGVPSGDTTTYTSNPTVVANTAYTLSEKDLSGYIEGTWSCKTVAGEPIAHPVTLSEGQNVICEITNNDIAPSITLIKDVVNNNGGTAGVNSFGLSVGGTGVASGQVYPVKANVSYAINEAGLIGYEFVSISGDGCPVNLGDTIVLNEGENITCTIKNDDKPGKLTVIKYVVNDDGGNLKPDDFTINVSGDSPSPASFLGSDTGTLVTLNAGNYNVTENLIDGYVPNYSSDCAGTIAIGESKTCTITNEDQAPKLTLVKTVVNDNGGTKKIADFPLFVGVTPVTSGVATTLTSNVEYTVSEINLIGYSASAWSGDCSADGKITLNPGDNKICYITNDDIQPKLTVTKVVDNSAYGDLDVVDFPLFVGTTSVVSGVQNGFNVGDYIVSETNKPGYSAVISGDCDLSGNVTLNPGDVKSCTITNTDNLGKIIIEKQTLPDGDAQLFTFNGEISGQIADGGTLEKIVTPGNYNVSETVPSGWDLTSVTCNDANSGASVAVSATANINVEANETVKCIFTNTKRSSITIVKNAINNNAQDFEFINNFDNNNPATFYLDDDSNATLPNTRTFEVLPGEYEVSEEAISGWQQESATCDNGETIDSINVEPGENVTCTFINEEYAKIVLIKNTIGGDDTFDFDATGDGLPEDIDLTTVSGTASQTFEGLDQDNTYGITENISADWNLTSATCTGEGNTPSDITPNAGEIVTCTFTNTKDATLTLEKTVNNDNGGSAEADDFQAKIDGNNVAWGVAQVVSASSHTASEVSLPGYTASDWGGDCAPNGTVTLSPGENKTCTITNDDIAPSLTLVKKISNDSDGTAAASDWTLYATGPTPIFGAGGVSSGLTFSAGTYILSESVGPANYTPSAWSCTGDVTNSDNSITLGLGQSATCEITNDDIDSIPTIEVAKTAGVSSIDEPGGNVTYTFTVKNLSTVESVTITSLEDDKFGTLAGDASCQVGTVLAIGASCTFNSTQLITGDTGSSHTNIFTAIAEDNEKNKASDDDDASVIFNDVIPIIEVTKTAIPTFVPETGGDVEYTFVVKNLSAVESVNIISLTDSVFGTLDGDADCQVGTSLAAGASCEFSITRLISGDYPGNHSNVFTAEAKDDEDNSATDNDDAIVDYTDVLPDITVTKDANPTEVPETGGDVKFTYTVTNNSTEAGTITGLADDKFGPLTGDDDCKVGTVLASKASCSFEATFNVPAGNAAGTHVDVFKVTLTDGDGNDDTATDDATVTYIGANITLDPLSATNNINDPHTFTATVMENPGNGWIAASGELVTFTLVNNTAGASFVNGNTCTTDVNGKCTIQINSTSPGTVEISGAVDVGLLNFTLHRETDGTLSSSVNAVKTYEAGKIIVEKQTLPDGSEQSFEFDPSWSDTNFNLTDGQSNDSGWLAPGTYNVSEVSLDGWDLTDAVCTASSDPTHSFDPRADGFSLVAGDTVTCVFTNTQRASVDVYKFNDLNGNGTHDEDEPYLSNWEMEMTEVEGESYKQITGDNGYTTFALEPAEYNLSETMQDGWVQSGIYCEEDNREGTLITAPGEAYGHHGNCSGWNGCGDAATCAQWACEVNGYEKVFSFGDQKPCTEFGNCNLFNYRGSVQKNWGNWCEVMGVTDIYCGNSADDDSSDYRSVAAFDLGADNNYSLAVDPGDSKNCYVGNFQKGDVTVWKYEDTDGVLGRTEGQEFWLGDPTFTFRLYEDIGEGWQFLSEKDTNNEGKAQFEDVFDSISSYFVCEVKKDGWENMQSLFNPANNQSGAADEYSVCEEVNVSSSGYNADVEFGNARYADIHGYKWEDVNGNRERDCEFKDAAGGDFESADLCEGESLLSGWTINLYKSNSVGGFGSEPIKTMVTDNSEEHFGWYWFEHLLPGEYKICEVLQTGWNQTYPNNDSENCHIVNLPDGNSNGFNESQNAVWGPEYNFGNQFVNPNLTIAKFNSQWPNIQAPGSFIDYTITVTASENNVNNVKVRDLLPKGFEYVSGSGTASSSLGGDHNGALELSHEYASPGEWSLGNMQSGEVVTLTYKAKIADNQEPGNYKDLAWADGTDDKSTRVIASSMPAPAVDPGEITDNFVGTQIEMAIAPTPQSVELEEETDTETKTKKKVLGVTTYLPATGTPNGWLMLALAIIIGGVGLMFVSRRKSKDNNLKDLSMKVMLLMIIGMGMIFATSNNVAQAETIAPSIRLEQPVSPTNDKNLDVGFVVLDIDNRPVTVDCYKKGPSDLVAVKFNTVALPAGGSSGVCEVVLDVDGNYDLYATASADGDSSPSNSVSVSLATNTPGAPTNYDRDDEGCTVTFNTANDGGLTKKVVLYRSTEAKFVADNSTKVQEGNFESNVSGSLTDPNGNCDDYFYAIQAVSEAGIGSSFVGDVDVDTETETRTRTVYDETIVYTGSGAIPVTEGEITEGAVEEGEAAQETEGEKAVQGEEAEGELVEGAESEGQVAGIFSEKNSKYWWAVGLIALFSAAYYGYRKYAQKNKKLPFDEE